MKNFIREVPRSELEEQNKYSEYKDYKANVVRSYYLCNEGSAPVTAKFRIIPKSDNLNFYAPSIEIERKIKANDTLRLLSFSKIKPLEDWGDYDVECEMVVLG